MGFRLGIVLISGILMGLAPAPVNLWPLAWVALIPLWVLVGQDTDRWEWAKKNKRRRINLSKVVILGLVWGIGYHGLALFWITGIHPMTWMGVPWFSSLAIAIFSWMFITLWGATLVTLWTTGISLFNSFLKHKTEKFTFSLAFSFLPLSLLRILFGTALWCLLESLWSSGPLWWTSLSYTQSPNNLAILHLGQLSGPNTITAAIVAVNALMAEAWDTTKILNLDLSFRSRVEHIRKIRSLKDARIKLLSFFSSFPLSIVFSSYFLIACILLISLHLLGFAWSSQTLIQPPETALKIGIIQGNVPNEIKLYPEGWRRAIEGYTKGYRNLAAQGVDAVLLPETALPYLWNPENLQLSSFYQAIQEKGIVGWVGTLARQEQSFTNSLLTITGNGEIFSRYDKVNLVPLGEYIPFQKFLGRLINRLSPLDAHLVPGSPDQVFNTPFGTGIVGICFDSAFAEHFRRQAAAGGQFILTASNDAHYHQDIMWQHHALDLMRAIETDRWVVRATNTGLSAIVDPHGKTQWISTSNAYEIHAGTIYRRQTQTLYVQWGDWLTPLLLVLTGFLLFINQVLQVIFGGFP